MGLRHFPHALVSIFSGEASTSIRALVGVSTALVLVAGCAAPASPATPTVAATSAPAVTTPTVAATSAPAVATLSPSPLATVAGTPVKKEETKELTPTPGEESEEGPPRPNALPTVGPGGNPLFAPVPGVDITKNGAAASIHGSAAAGQTIFAQNCVACHNAEGKGGLANPGSEDGTVPPLNPIDPAFKANAKGDPAAFAREIDLFVQHGSRPSGDSPALSMPPWGDQGKLTQQQIADVEAYVMQLNGVSWPSQ